MTTLYFFGDRWDVPMLFGAVSVPTPVDIPCLYCTEPVIDGEQGVMRNAVRLVGSEPEAGWEPAHRECDLRTAIGSIAHLEGRCLCRNPGAQVPPHPGSFRDEARAVLAWTQTH